MTLSLAPRYWFPDEEPEPDFPWLSRESYAGLCAFCGRDDHDDNYPNRCPNRPFKELA